MIASILRGVVRGQCAAKSDAEKPEIFGQRRRGSAALDRQPKFDNLAAKSVMHDPKFLTPCIESIVAARR